MDMGGNTMENLFDEIKVLRMFFEEEDDPDKKLDLDDPDKKLDKKEEDDKTYSADEFDKSVQRRQAALKRARDAEDKTKALKAKMDTLPDEEEFNTLKDNYDKMQQTLKDLEDKHKVAEIEKIKDERERERAKITQEFKKEQEGFESELDKLRTEISQHTEEKVKQAKVTQRYRRQALEGAVVGAASKKAFNPQQVVKLLVDDFTYDEEDDRWYKEIYDNAGKLKEMLSVDEYVESFLVDPINENLLKADVKSGSDTPRGKKQPDGGTPVKEEPADEMYSWAARVGLNINKKSTADDKAWLVDKFNRLHKRVKEENK